MGSYERPHYSSSPPPHHPSASASRNHPPIPPSFYHQSHSSSSPEQPTVPHNSPRRSRQHAERGAPLPGGRQLLPTDPSAQYIGPASPIVEQQQQHGAGTERPLRRIGPHFRRLSIIPDQSEPPSPHSPAHTRRDLSPEARNAAGTSSSSRISPKRSPERRSDYYRGADLPLEKPLPNPHDVQYATVPSASSEKSRRRESQAGYAMASTPAFAPDPPSPLAALVPLQPPKEERRRQGYTAPPVHGTRRKVPDPEADPAGSSLRIDVAKAQSAQLLARGPQRPGTTESWASDESTPTQTPTDAVIPHRPGLNTVAADVQLVPVTLSPTFPRPHPQPASGHVGAVSALQTDQPPAARGPPVRHSRSLPVPPSPAASYQPHVGASQSGPAVGQQRASMGMAPSVVRLPDGRVVPTQRNDFDNMRRFSVAKPSSSGASNIEGSSRQGAPAPAPTPEAALHRVPRKSAPLSVSNQALADFDANAPSQQVSPRQSQPASPKHRPLILTGQDPLPARAAHPAAPRLPHPLRFRKSDPAIGTPEHSRPGTGAQTPPMAHDGSRRSLDEMAPTRETFGPASALFEEAARRLEQQAQAKGVGPSGRQRRSDREGATGKQVQDTHTVAAPPLTEAQAYALRNSASGQGSQSRAAPQPDVKQKQPEPSTEAVRRASISSEKTVFDEAEYQAHRSARRSSQDRVRRAEGEQAESTRRRSSGDKRADRKLASGLAGPPSDVKEEPENAEKSRDSVETRRGDPGIDDDTKKPMGEVDEPAGKLQKPSHEVAVRQQTTAPGVTFPAAVLARPNTRGMRPTTGGTVRSGLSFHSKTGHQRAGDICPHCFRAGFDCALNLHTGTGGQGRKAFQQFVQSGIAGLLTAPNSPSVNGKGVISRPVTRDSSRFSTGGSHFHGLGSVAFGESALSRPVTRGRMEQLLAERDFAGKDVNEKVSYDEFVRRLQEEEARQNDQEKQPWTIAMDGQGREILTEKKEGDAGPETPPLTPAVEQHDHFGHGGFDEPTWQPKRASLLRRETNRTIISTIDQASVRSEGQFTLRTGLTFGFFGAVLFAVQILDSGLSGPMDDDTLDQPANSPAALGGRLAFFWGEALGIFLGAFLYRFGPWILVGDITLAGVFALVAGFSQTYFALNILRGLIGLCGGVIFMFSIGNLLDMLPSSRNRYLGLLFLILLISIPQLTGPWVAQAFQSNLSWRWLYWAAAIATACAVPFLMLLAREPWLARVSTPNAVHDGRHGPGQGFRVFILPYSLLLMHPHLLLSSISTVFGLGIFTLLLINVHSLWVDTYHFTDTQAGVATTICSLIGLITALVWTLITAAFRADKPKRRLHLDEDGYIRVTPSKRPEQRLFKVAGGLLMSAITLFLIAVTVRTSVHWVATALLFSILAAGVILSIIGALHYPIEVYHPASALIIATSFEELPNLHGLTEEQHWGRQFTLSAVAGMVGITLTVVGIMTFIAPAGVKNLGFSTLCVVLACCALVAAGSTVLLLRLGAGMRQKAWKSHHDSMKRAEEWRTGRLGDAELGLGFGMGGGLPSEREQRATNSRGSGGAAGQQSGRQSSQRTSQRPSGGTQQAPVRPAPGPLQPSSNSNDHQHNHRQSSAMAGEIIGQIPNVVGPRGGNGIGPGTPPVSAASRRLSTAARTNSRMSVRQLVTRGKSSWSQISGRYPILPQISPSDRPSFVTQLPLSMPLAPGLREEMMQVGMQSGNPSFRTSHYAAASPEMGNHGRLTRQSTNRGASRRR